ncbi:MAG: hypothetical protein LBQ66_05675 [Planctomycetaceae bacterium]|jgi:hypothetical protein|nr:hypothetical protein [Planctomycetaceae bacterium]
MYDVCNKVLVVTGMWLLLLGLMVLMSNPVVAQTGEDNGGTELPLWVCEVNFNCAHPSCVGKCNLWVAPNTLCDCYYRNIIVSLCGCR